MRKNTAYFKRKLIRRSTAKRGNDEIVEYSGDYYWRYHGTAIVKLDSRDRIYIRGTCPSTKERLNAFVPIHVSKGDLYMNGKTLINDDLEWICIG